MSTIIQPLDVKSSILEKEEIYFDFQEDRIDADTFLKKIDRIDNPKMKKWVKYAGRISTLLIMLIFPFFLHSKSVD